MTYTPEAFRKFCYEAAKQFLQTVVVIDDEAEFDDKSEATGQSQSWDEIRMPTLFFYTILRVHQCNPL